MHVLEDTALGLIWYIVCMTSILCTKSIVVIFFCLITVCFDLKFGLMYDLLLVKWAWSLRILRSKLWKQKTHVYCLACHLSVPLFSDSPYLKSSITKPLDLLSPSIFPADDNKRPPKAPTFGDFLSQGTTQGPRGDRGRGRGRGQKPSYR